MYFYKIRNWVSFEWEFIVKELAIYKTDIRYQSPLLIFEFKILIVSNFTVSYCTAQNIAVNNCYCLTIISKKWRLTWFMYDLTNSMLWSRAYVSLLQESRMRAPSVVFGRSSLSALIWSRIYNIASNRCIPFSSFTAPHGDAPMELEIWTNKCVCVFHRTYISLHTFRIAHFLFIFIYNTMSYSII